MHVHLSYAERCRLCSVLRAAFKLLRVTALIDSCRSVRKYSSFCTGSRERRLRIGLRGTKPVLRLGLGTETSFPSFELSHGGARRSMDTDLKDRY